MFKLAGMFVDITARDAAFRSQLGGIHGQMTAAGMAFATTFGNLASTGISRAVDAITGFFAGGISGAMELEDAMSAVQVIFGSSAGIIIGEAERLAAVNRVVKGEYINAANSFGAAFKGAGSSQAEAAALGNQLAQLGIDMQSFATNATQQEAFTALQAALRGEFDPLERFTVFLSAAKIEAEAMAMGLIKNKSELDDHAKKQATLSLIMKATKDQQGDQVRSLNTSKGLWTQLSNSVSNASTAMGVALRPITDGIMRFGLSFSSFLMPAVQATQPYIEMFVAGAGKVWGVLTNVVGVGLKWAGSLISVVSPAIRAIIGYVSPMVSAYLSKFNDMGVGLAGLGEKFTEGAAIIGQWAAATGQWIADALGPGAMQFMADFAAAAQTSVLDTIDLIGFAWRNLPDEVDIAAIKFFEVFTNIGEWASTIPENLGLIGKYVQNNWRELMVDGINAVSTAFENLGTNIGGLWTAMMGFFRGEGFNFTWTKLFDGFEATADQLPELIKPKLTSMQSSIDSKISDIVAKEAKRGLSPTGLPAASISAMDDLMAWALASGEFLPEEYGALFDKEKEREKGKDKFKSETLDSADFSRKMRSNILSGADAVPEKQLTELQLIRKAIEEQGALAARDIDEAFARLG